MHFTSSEGAAQTVTLRRVEGVQKATGTGDDGRIIVEGAPGLDGAGSIGNGEAGLPVLRRMARSDTFFFDVQGALNNLPLPVTVETPTRCCSIALEVPNSALSPGKMGLWVRTLDGESGKWFRRIAVRAKSSSLLAGEQNAAYLAAEPADDARFIPVFAHAGAHRRIYLTGSAFGWPGPCSQTSHYDPTRPASFPNNGRILTDDVVDFFLPILTMERVTQDKVGPHKYLLAGFPYMGPPHKAYATKLVGA